MIKEGRFGVQGGNLLITITIAGKVFFTSPGYLSRLVGNAGWYTTLISSTTTIFFFSFICLLLKRFRGKDIIEIYNISLGKILGFSFSIILTVAFLFNSAVIAREYVELLKVYILPDWPINYLIGFLFIPITISVFLGLESIARAAKLLAYPLLFMLIVLLLLASQKFELTNLYPITGYGFDKVVVHGLRRSSAYSEVMMILAFANSFQGIEHIKKTGYISLIFSGLIISITLLSCSLYFPYTANQELVSPVYSLGREVYYGKFLQRLDPIFLYLWTTSTFIAISILPYSSVSTYCKIFKINDIRPVIMPMIIIMFLLAILPKDFTSIIEGYIQTFREYGWIVFYILPMITLVVAVMRNVRGDNIDG